MKEAVLKVLNICLLEFILFTHPFTFAQGGIPGKFHTNSVFIP